MNMDEDKHTHHESEDHTTHHHDAHHHHDDMGHTGHDSGHGGHHMGMMEDFKKRFWLVLVLTIPLTIISPMIMAIFNYTIAFPYMDIIEFVLATVIFIYGGKPFLQHAGHELKQGAPGMMMLISLAIVAAYAYSLLTTFFIEGMNYYFELATLILIMLAGHYIEMKSQMSAGNALETLAQLLPSEANKLAENGHTELVKVSDLQKDDAILIKPGEKVPIDALVFDGHSDVDEAMLTGESVPVEKNAGDEIVGGSINGDGVLKAHVKKTGSDTYLSQVMTMVQDAQQQKSRAQSLADRAAKWLFYIALLAGLLAFFVWQNVDGFLIGLQFMVAVFVIACPHALGLAVPLVNAESTSLAAGSGLLIQNRIPFEDAHSLDKIVFDKTGTLTKGEFGIDEIRVLNDHYSIEDILQIAYSIEHQSEHPIAKGIVKEAEAKGIEALTVTDYHNLTGQGLEGQVAHKTVKILSPNATRNAGFDFNQTDFEDSASKGRTVVFVIYDGQLIGSIAVSDVIRESAKEVVQNLHQAGIEVIMITGDNDQVAQYVGKALNLDGIFSEVLSDEKAAHIKQLQNDGSKVGMVGDGVNDAPALAQADLGVAIGAGTDVAMDTADIILVDSNIKDVLNILALSKATRKKINQNLAWGAGYNIVAIPLAAGVLAPLGIVITPAVGAVIMSFSTVICAVNARRLKKIYHPVD